MSYCWIVVGAVSGLISVATGAFGAHGLAQTLSERALSIWETAAQYQMYHSLALVGVGLWIAHQPQAPLAQAAAWAFTVGIFIFAGSLYALALTDIKILGAITPIGGTAFMIGWALLAVSAWRTST